MKWNQKYGLILHGQKQIKKSKSCKNPLKVVTISEPKANKKKLEAAEWKTLPYFDYNSFIVILTFLPSYPIFTIKGFSTFLDLSLFSLSSVPF